jgi:uncharacterized protein YegP (UPF0339 family)
MYFQIVPRSGGYRALLKGDNHELVWMTEIYVRKAGAEHAIDLAKAKAATAPVEDLT